MGSKYFKLQSKIEKPTLHVCSAHLKFNCTSAQVHNCSREGERVGGWGPSTSNCTSAAVHMSREGGWMGPKYFKLHKCSCVHV